MNRKNEFYKLRKRSPLSRDIRNRYHKDLSDSLCKHNEYSKQEMFALTFKPSNEREKENLKLLEEEIHRDKLRSLD